MCKWFEKTLEDLGGSDESHEMLSGAVAERWGVPRFEIVRILRNKAKWKAQCEERGVGSKGLLKDEAALPQYLRKSRRNKGTVRRAIGGGRKDPLRFLYPLVRDFFELMRVHGKYVDPQDLEDYLMHTMQRYVDEAAKVEVVIEKGSKLEKRLEVVKAELTKLRAKETTKRTHEHRQGQLMRFVGARLRTPQRLTVLSLSEERGRWMSTLKGYDRLLWESMRPELLRDRVVDPEGFVAGLEDAVVIHADQVPCWLRVSQLKQLYGSVEVKRRKKKHEEAVPNLSEPGQQKQICEEEDGMTQIRQNARSEGDRFRVTVELAQVVGKVWKPPEAPTVRHAKPVLVAPGAHGRLSNIDEAGNFIKDEIFEVRGKQKVRKAGTSAGNLMLSWRKLRDGGDPEVRSFFKDIEVMQQPAAFCDGVIISWIAEMRKNEGYSRVISVRDMFAGGLSQSAKRMSIVTSQLLSFIAGKMTPVMQLTDVAVAFSLKKQIEACKAELRREKRGIEDLQAAPFEDKPREATCDAADLMKVLGLPGSG